MIRVLHYIPGFLYGGIESMFLSWYKNIDNDQIQFELLIRTQEDSAPALKKYREMQGVYYRLAPMSFSHIRQFKVSVDEFFKEHHNYDILHAHETDPFILASAKKYGIKKIVIHSHTTMCGKDIKSQLRYYDERITSRIYADYAFACSELAAKWKFGKRTFKGHPVTIIHNAVMTEKYDYNTRLRKKKREELGLGNSFVIGHIGRMTTPKNQFFLLDIFAAYLKQNSEAILLMIGDGPDEIALKSSAVKLGIADHINFMGTRSDIYELLQAIDCFLLPSKWEGLPVTLMEAQAAGLPCIISDNISQEADITNNVTRISIQKSPEHWAKTLEEVRKNYTRLSTRKNIIENGFDMEQEVFRLIKMYQEIEENKG